MTRQRSPLAPLSLLIAVAIAVVGCAPSSRTVDDPAGLADVPEPPREFRAAWVATVANIDWPSKPGVPTAQAKQELLAILDRCVELNLNAVILQVRPAADALYPSSLEPWSEFLTGASGQAPDEPWDPLAFAVEEAHARGLQLHAWFNPYRAMHPSGKTPLAESHMAVTRPDLVKRYGAYLWMDPGEPEIIEHSLAVMLDVVRRYDVDGIHMDDYFYPYPISEEGRELRFPDDISYRKYLDTGGTLTRNDWRRKNVDDFVQELYKRTKAMKPHVLVGISPFGISRPGRPEFIRGFDQYEKLYADAERWLREGWLDYMTPQLYWPISKPDQSFTALLGWWVENNPKDRHIWPGLATYRHFNPNDAPRYPVNEFAYQVRWARYLTDVSDGHVHFSMKWLMPAAEQAQGGPVNGAAMIGALRGVYGEKALVPATPWLAKGPAPASPTAAGWTRSEEGFVVSFDAVPDGPADALRVIQVGAGDTWATTVIDAADPQAVAAIPDGYEGASPRVVAFTVDRFGRRGPKAELGPRVIAAPTAETQAPEEVADAQADSEGDAEPEAAVSLAPSEAGGE
ncbi:MAG: family 10 glycosylhydrolase [Planctomycetota bacterium]